MKFNNSTGNREVVGQAARSWGDLLRATKNLRGDGSQWVFRALGAWHNVVRRTRAEITSSFDDACKRSMLSKRKAYRHLYEASMLSEFKREAHHHLADLPAPNDFLEWLALGRHYSMPSRLVDFTYSFYVAAYFAISTRGNYKNADGRNKREDGCVLALNLTWLKEQVEQRLSDGWLTLDPPIEQRRQSFHDPKLFHEFAFSSGATYVVPVNPLRRNPRLARQRGLFLCPGNIKETFEKNLEATLETKKGVKKLIFLHHKLRSDAMRNLRQMNIGLATLYADLPGWAESRRDLVHQDMSKYDERFKEELEVAISKEPRI